MQPAKACIVTTRRARLDQDTQSQTRPAGTTEQRRSPESVVKLSDHSAHDASRRKPAVACRCTREAKLIHVAHNGALRTATEVSELPSPLAVGDENLRAHKAAIVRCARGLHSKLRPEIEHTLLRRLLCQICGWYLANHSHNLPRSRLRRVFLHIVGHQPALRPRRTSNGTAARGALRLFLLASLHPDLIAVPCGIWSSFTGCVPPTATDFVPQRVVLGNGAARL